MNEHDKARPVSGEIMTAGGGARPSAAPAEFAEAEYVTVDDLPAEPDAPAPAPAAVAGMDFLRHDGAGPAARPRQHGGALFWSTGLALVALAFWVSGGHALVRQSLPQVAPAAAQPLRIGEVRSRVESRNGRDVLFVDGRAENHGDAALALPPIEISVVDGDGRTTRYFLGTNGSELAPGGRYSFSSRLEAPRNGVRTVTVAFREGAL